MKLDEIKKLIANGVQHYYSKEQILILLERVTSIDSEPQPGDTLKLF